MFLSLKGVYKEAWSASPQMEGRYDSRTTYGGFAV